MKKVRVRLESDSYDILIGANILPQLGGYMRKMGFRGPAVIITNTLVKELYAEYVGGLLDKEGFEVSLLSVNDGEAFKTMESAMQLYIALSNLKAERTTPIIAVGGGVIGDLAGFVAATYLRGVPLIHVPTTLLSQVDSSIGGKAGVDLSGYKNIVGSFYQPELVMADIATLTTLPPVEMSNGIAEVIKYGVIKDPHLFNFTSLNLSLIKSCEYTALEEIITRSAAIKADVVSEDELDTGLRNILNFGHTAGHAIETVSNFSVKHGYAVSVGMMIAARIATTMGIFNTVGQVSMKEVIEGAGLPVSLPDLGMELQVEDILEAISHDKKISGGKLRFVLPRSIGSVTVSDTVKYSLVRHVLENNQ